MLLQPWPGLFPCLSAFTLLLPVSLCNSSSAEPTCLPGPSYNDRLAHPPLAMDNSAAALWVGRQVNYGIGEGILALNPRLPQFPTMRGGVNTQQNSP